MVLTCFNFIQKKKIISRPRFSYLVALQQTSNLVNQLSCLYEISAADSEGFFATGFNITVLNAQAIL